MEVVVNSLCERCAHTVHRGKVGDAGAAHRLGRAEGLQQRLLAGGADAGNLVQRVDANGLRPPRPVRADGKAMRFIAEPLDVIEHRIAGLEVGVDDYLPKPFEPRELLLRLQNILRRGRAPVAGNPVDEVRMGAYVFYISRGELKRDDESIKLTERERDLLRQFAQRPGTPIQRHELSSDDTTGSERAIDVQINRLRRKIEADPSNPVYLQTVRGKGYILYTD